MNGSENPDRLFHTACISIGSNIDPAHNIIRAVLFLRETFNTLEVSNPYETHAFGSQGPNFINLAVKFSTRLDYHTLKSQVLTSIEARLGRIRSIDKNAPRTIDLDIIVFDGTATDQDIWKRVYLAVPLAELLPDLRHPETGQTICEAAQKLRVENFAIPHPEILDGLKGN